MRVGELDDSVGREFAARRDAMATTVARLGERLAEPAIPAVAPAVTLSDSVHISAEARAAQFGKAQAGLALPRFPSPVELVAALRETVASTGPAQAVAVEKLGELVRRLAQSFPAPAAARVTQQSDAVADQLVRALVANAAGQGGPGGQQEDVMSLVRQLVSAFPMERGPQGPGMPATTPFERAAVSVLMALTRVSASDRNTPSTSVVAAQEHPFPAALLGLLAGVSPVVRRPRRGRRPSDEEVDEESHDDDTPGSDYRSSPRRK